MKIIKKIYFVLLLCCVSCFLSGCVDVKINEELTINPDKTMVHEITCLVGNNMSMFSDEIQDGLTTRLTDSGFTNVFPVNELNYFGMKGIQNSIIEEFKNTKNEYFSIEDNSIDYFIFKYVDVTANIDMSSILNTDNSSLVTISEYTFTLNLPVKIRKSNADNLLNDDKTGVWNLGVNGKNSIHIECVYWNITNIIITIFVLLLFVVVILFYFYKKPRSKKRNKCPKCSSLIKEGELFCGNCGTKL